MIMDSTEDFGRKAPEKLVSVAEIDIRKLAEIYDERDVYLSVYLPTNKKHETESFVSSRMKAIEKAISQDLRGIFKETASMAKDAFDSDTISGEKGRIIFASAPHSFLHVYRIGLELDAAVILDTSPFLLPLAKLMDDYQDYGILLLDSREARLFCVRSDILEERDHISTDLMNKHKKGGWSQMRFNRLRKGAIKSFLTQVVADLQEKCDDSIRGIVIAGPGDAKNQLEEMLPIHILEKVLGVVDISMDAPKNEILKRADKIALEDERIKSEDRAKELRAEILKSGLAAYGPKEVRDALNQGRVNVLVLLKDVSIPGWICERCQNLGEGALPKSCPNCGGPTSRADLAEELYELAKRTGAEVEFVEEDSCLESIGGVGALLRY